MDGSTRVLQLSADDVNEANAALAATTDELSWDAEVADASGTALGGEPTLSSDYVDGWNDAVGQLSAPLADLVRSWLARSVPAAAGSAAATAPSTPEPIPVRLTCPACGQLHVDEEFATRPHHTHACQHCGMTWRPAVVPTVGVRFLPGFRDAATPDSASWPRRPAGAEILPGRVQRDDRGDAGPDLSADLADPDLTDLTLGAVAVVRRVDAALADALVAAGRSAVAVRRRAGRVAARLGDAAVVAAADLVSLGVAVTRGLSR